MNWSDMIFQGWTGILRTLIVGTLAYVFLIISLRASGKRTLAKLNAFDLVITVALGSTFATILLSEKVALAEGIAALVLLVALQWVVAFISVRSSAFAGAVRSEPTLLVRNGKPLLAAMKRERVTEEELTAIVRTGGRCGIGDVAAVVLESDGSFSVLDECETIRAS